VLRRRPGSVTSTSSAMHPRRVDHRRSTGLTSNGQFRAVRTLRDVCQRPVCNIVCFPVLPFLAGMSGRVHELPLTSSILSLGTSMARETDHGRGRGQPAVLRHARCSLSPRRREITERRPRRRRYVSISRGHPGRQEALASSARSRHDGLAAFLEPGARIGDFGVKPDITAPGRESVACACRSLRKPSVPIGDLLRDPLTTRTCLCERYVNKKPPFRL